MEYQEPTHTVSLSDRRLSYSIAGLILIVTLFLWYFLMQLTHVHFFYVIKPNETYSLLEQRILIMLPWITLLLGISLAILFTITIRLAQLNKQRAQFLAAANHDLKKEIAERIQAEITKQKLERALLHGQKLQAIGTLAGGIAHDFNNIIYAIRGYVEMARDDIAEDSLVHQNLGKVLEATQRAQELIARILTFSRRQHHELKIIQLKEILQGALSLLKPTIPASVIIQVNSATVEDCTILGNETPLHQIFVNIINNAVDAMDGEGTVTIQLSQVLAQDDILSQFPNRKNQNYCKIEITDTGSGMDQTTMTRIFEPFYTTKEVGKGTGLGLSTVHAIITEHQGEILVSSQLGHGTTFTLLLPEYAAAKEKAHGENLTG